MDIISISDSSSDEAGALGEDGKATPPHNDEVEITTISSLKTSNVRTSKKSNLSLLNSKPFCSPSPKSKVTCWLSKNSVEDFGAPLEEAPLIIDTDFYFEGFKERTPTKNSIIVRQDYKKSLNETDTKLSHSSSDVISVHSRNSSVARSEHETPPPVRIMNDLVKSMTSLCEQVPKNGDDVKPVQQFKASTDTPMSPESRKKNELCEYLKLMNMNPSDKKVINLRQNRRSTRVKHLAIMTEKRELDKRLHKEIEDMEKTKEAERRPSISSKTAGRRRNGSVESLIESSETSKKAGSILCDDESVKSDIRNGSKLKLNTQKVPSPSKQTTDAINSSINGRSPVEFNEKGKLSTNFESNPLKFVIPLARISTTPIDFEESIKDVLMDENIFKKSQTPIKVKQKTPKKTNLKKSLKSLLVKWNTNSTKPTKLKRKDSKINRILKRIVKSKPKNPSGFKKSSQENRKKSKLKNFLVDLKQVNKLRSRGRLKRVEITTLLRKSEKIKKTNKIKRTKKKVPSVLQEVQEPLTDEDKQIENSSSSNKETTFSHKSIDLIFFEQKIHQINTELNYLNNLTPEHRKALFESKKFLDNGTTKEAKKEKETISDFVPFRGFCNEVTTKVPKEKVSSFENDPISCEDLEVDRLMSGRELNGSTDGLETFSSTSSNSSSMQIVEDIASPVPCTSKDQAEVETTTKTPDSLGESETSDEDSEYAPLEPEVVNIAQIKPSKCKFVNAPVEVEVKSLHHYLTQPLKKLKEKYRSNSPSSQKNFGDHFSAEKKTSQSHTIFLSNTNGCVMGAYYLDYNLIVVQELLVSFWNQTPLGSVLGAQDMWIPKGNTSRIVLSNGCIPIESSEMVISADTLVAYFELWVKEHKSDKRERPVADIFVTIYFRNRSGPDKKVLQLENIHSSPNDVQYVVLRNTPNIVVTWNVTDNDVSTTVLHCYQLSPDYQTVISIKKMQTISHYVSSLHNIQDCDTLIMVCGNGKVTLCNVEFGYVVATIDLVQIIPQPRILWARCDRGFLFTLHQFEDGSLHLIAINSFDSTWKKLQTYKPGGEFENLSGVCMENGILVAFYENGILCWSARSGDLLLEDGVDDNIFFPFGKYVIVVINNQVHVRHALGYLMCED